MIQPLSTPDLDRLRDLIRIIEISTVDLEGRYPFDLIGLTEDECDDWWMWLELEICPRPFRETILRGGSPEYQQGTPKERILAWFNAVVDGRQMTYRQVVEEWSKLCNAN